MKPKLNINEDFICRIWEGGKLFLSGLQTLSGDDLEVVSLGTRNYSSGPDYTNAKVKIAGKTYSGDIEVHRDFKNWLQHSHQLDRRYNSVILHVVMWDSNERISPKLRIKRYLPSVILSNHLNTSIHNIWQQIITNPSKKFRIPCFEKNSDISDDIILKMLKITAAQRLELKSDRIKNRLFELSGYSNDLPKNKNLWQQVLYEFIFEALGFAKNKEQMLKLSSSVTLMKLKQYAGNDILKIQASLYGAAGLFFDVRSPEPYINELKSIWHSIENKLMIKHLDRSNWHFFGQRPQNFPTLRIAFGSQIALKIIQYELFKNMVLLFSSNVKKPAILFSELKKLFHPQKDNYWSNHHDLGKASKAVNILGGEQRITDIIINAIFPLMHFYGNTFKNQLIINNVNQLYENITIKPDNSIIRIMQQQLLSGRKIKINTPALEQAIIQLHNFYCTREKCDKCLIGKDVFKNKGYDYKIIYY